MPGVEVRLEEGAGQVRDELGRFTSEVNRATSAAASNAARKGAAIARGIYAATGLGWDVDYSESGGGGVSYIDGTGQWVEAAEYGIPPHVISTEKWSLYNPEEDFPRNPRRQLQEVEWKPNKAVPHHIVERAGDQIAAEFEAILVSFLP